MIKVHSDSPLSSLHGTPKVKPEIPIDILDDLSSRFVINLPQHEKEDKIRLMFQIEIAHWFYIDFYCCQRNDLIKHKLYPFGKILMNHIPFLRIYTEETLYQKLFAEWKEYKSNVPSYGAILLDKTLQYVLLVQGFANYTNWGFPKGKVNANEDPIICACREVEEETGFNCSHLVKASDFIEMRIRGSMVRLYIVPGVDKCQKFEPRTRGEIRKIEWFRIDDLPSHRNDTGEGNANTFFMAIPFITPLRKWIAYQKSGLMRNKVLSIKTNKRNRKISKERSVNCRRKIFSSESSSNGASSTSSDGATNSCNECQEVNTLEEIKISLPDSFAIQTKFWAKAWDNFVIEWDQLWSQVLDKL